MSEGNRRALFVIGMPGSGKTTYARSLGESWTLVDDPKGPDDYPWVVPLNLVITNPYFCLPDRLQEAEDLVKDRWPDMTIDRVYFENEPAECLKNATRAGREVRGLLVFLNKVYKPPEGAIRVWREEENEPRSVYDID